MHIPVHHPTGGMMGAAYIETTLKNSQNVYEEE